MKETRNIPVGPQFETLEDIFNNAINSAKSTLPCSCSFIYLLTKENDFFLKCHNFPDSKFPLKKRLSRHSHEIITMVDSAENDHLRKNLVSTLKIGSKHKNFFVFPLKNKYRLFGILGVIDAYGSADQAQLRASDRRKLISLSQITASLVIKQKAVDKLNFVIETVDLVSKGNNKKEIFLQLANKLTTNRTKFSACIVHLYDEVKNNLYGFVSSGIKHKNQQARIELNNSSIGSVFKDGLTRIVNTQSKEFAHNEWAKKNKFVSMITVQLKDRNQSIFGTLSLFTKYEYREEEHDKLFLSTFLAQISTVIERITYEDRIKKLSAVDEIIAQIIPAEEIDYIVKIFLEEILKTLNGEIGYISLLDKESSKITATYKADITGQYEDFVLPHMLDINHTNSISAWVIQQGHGYLYPSINEIDKLFQPYNGLRSNEIRNELLAPLLYEEKVIGLLVLSSTRENVFETKDLTYVETFAKKVAQVIQIKKFYKASSALNQQTFGKDEDTICRETARITADVLSTPICCVWLIRRNEEEEYLSLMSTYGCSIEDPDTYSMKKSEHGLSWQVISSARSGGDNYRYHTYDDIASGENGFKHVAFARKHELKSMISIPIVHNNSVLGVINTYTKRKYKFFDTECVLLNNIAIRCGDALSNARLDEKNKMLMDRWVATNVIANPGIVAMTFVHDITHMITYLNNQINILDNFLPDNIKKKNAIDDTLENISMYAESLRKSFTSLVRIGKKVKTNKRPYSIKTIVEDIKHLFSAKFKDKIQFTYEIQSNDILVNCYSNEIEQVFVNLILNSVNALDQVSHRKREIKIKVEKFEHDESKNKDWVKIEVYDNGAGIKREDAAKIFDMDYSTKGEEGSGFGLSICKRIVETNHKGIISHESIEGQWTKFYISLPLN